jgi:hypothetical protein
MHVIVVHTLQWIFICVCVPLFGLLLYSLFKAWREDVPPALEAPHHEDTEYRRGYSNGWEDGYEYAGDEDSEALATSCSMTHEAADFDDDGEVPS